MTFESVTTPTRVSDQRFRIDVPDGYQQGRGAFGGLVIATIVRAVTSAFGGPERALRTLTAELCGPVMVGPTDIVVEPLRIGSGTATIAARVLQDGELRTHAVLVLGRGRVEDANYEGGLPRPAIPSWREVPALPNGRMPPPFANHFEFRPTGPAPFSGGTEAHAAGFVRPRDPGALRDAAFVAGLADAWWPALFGVMRGPRPMATLTFTLDLVSDTEGLDPEAPYFHEARTMVSRGGFAPELRTLWGADGRLLAINHQTFVVIQ
jgi:hypothetical protein